MMVAKKRNLCKSFVIELRLFLEAFRLVSYIGWWFLLFFRLMYACMSGNLVVLICLGGISVIVFKWADNFVFWSFRRRESHVSISIELSLDHLLGLNFILSCGWRLVSFNRYFGGLTRLSVRIVSDSQMFSGENYGKKIMNNAFSR